MKKVNLFIYFIFIIVGCDKPRPITNVIFTTDKSQYRIGETIKCTFENSNDFTPKWSDFEGNNSESNTFNCYIDSALEIGGKQKTIELNVYDLSNKFIGTCKKEFPIPELILPTDYYTLFQPPTQWGPADTTKVIPTNKTTKFSSGYFYVQVRKGIEDTHRYFNNNTLLIRLNHKPSSSETFIIRPENVALANNEAFISTYFYGQSLYSLEGELNIQITTKGKIRAIFNDVKFDSYNDTLNWRMSGDITCH